MSVELSNDDRCVLDLLLERDGETGITPCYTTASTANLQMRMGRVENVLNLLNHYSVEEPAVDLVSRTLSRCAEDAPTIYHQATHHPMSARTTA